jgi:hypothetical protein
MMWLYWRIKWELWAMRAPSMVGYNMTHAHKIDRRTYLLMVDKWKAAEPVKGTPRSVREALLKEATTKEEQ